MNATKRLWQYAMHYRKSFLIALAMLAIAVTTELSGPFIAKTMIDQHVLGIEKPWYAAAGEDKDTVLFGGTLYKRGDRFTQDEQRGAEATVLQVGRSFVFVAGAVTTDGERNFQAGDGNASTGLLNVVSKGGSIVSYPAQRLTTGELFAFYRPEVRYLMQLSALYLVLLAVSAGFHYGQKYMLQTTANRVIQRMRGDIYGQIHRLPVHYFDNLPAGKVVSRVTNDTEAVKDLFVTVLMQFFSGAVYLVAIYTALFLLDVRLAAACLIIVPILVVWIVVYRKFATQYNHVIRSRVSDINGMINESIQGMNIIRVFRRHKQTTAEFEALNEDLFQYQSKLLNLNSITSHNLVGFTRNLTLTGLIWYFGSQAINSPSDVVSFGVIYAFVDYITRLFNPIVGMVNQLGLLDQSMVSAERVFRLMDEPGTDVEEGKLPRYKGNVVFDHVSFAYKEGEDVLKNITFEAKQGETVALVGHTGSGKSSIMNLLFRFYDPQRGRITIDGMSTQDLPKQLLRQHMGIVLQDPFLFTGTIAGNVSLLDPAVTRERVNQALDDVGAKEILGSLPGGYDEPVIEKGSTLSAGQRQLVSFARALAFDPAILILDEATASIDTETEAIIQNALGVLKKGRTTFIIAHRLSTIRAADQILVLHRGEIVERGTHESLMQQQGRYHRMYQLQQGMPSTV